MRVRLKQRMASMSAGIYQRRVIALFAMLGRRNGLFRSVIYLKVIYSFIIGLMMGSKGF